MPWYAHEKLLSDEPVIGWFSKIPEKIGPGWPAWRALRLARRRAGMTQAQVAMALGVEKGVYSSWERGERQMYASTLAELSKILSCPADILLDAEAAPGEGAAMKRTRKALEGLTPSELSQVEQFAKALAAGRKQKARDRN